jgi:DNA-binding MarR family transcriptional regulator
MPEDGTASPRIMLRADISDEQLNALILEGAVDVSALDKCLVPRAKLTKLACVMYETRRTRSRFLNGTLLGEPVWDMLLALYCLASRGEALSVSGLCLAADVPPTTALRWAQLMEQKKLIERKRDPKDGRRTYLSLTDEGDAVLSAYLSSIYGKMHLDD